MLILECTEAQEMCRNLQPFLNIIKIFLEVLRWTVPVLLIALGSIDMFKAVSNAEDEKALQDSRRTLIKRIVYGIIVFLVPFIVNLIMELVDEAIKTSDTVTATTWISCWNESINTSGCSDIYAPEDEPDSETKEGVTCNCKVCENGTNSCQYAEIGVGACRAEGGTCQ